MANFKDIKENSGIHAQVSGSKVGSAGIQAVDSGFIHELARGEIYPDADRLLEIGSSFDPQQLVEESTVVMLSELREVFTEYARLLNGYSENGSRFQEVKIYSVANTAADFMIFRNQIKLLVCNVAHGVVQISFSLHNRNPLSIDGRGQESAALPQSETQELQAQVGPFREVFWTFQNEKVVASQVAKFYFSEFVRVTRDTKKRGTNQLLLDQIKTLLQEKGFDL